MEHPSPKPPSFWKSPAGLALAVALGVGGFLLYEEHQAHFWGALPYLLLLACPLISQASTQANSRVVFMTTS